MVSRHTSEDKVIQEIVERVRRLSIDGRDRLMASLAEDAELFPAWVIKRKQESIAENEEGDDSGPVINSRYGDIGQKLLRILHKDDSIGVKESALIKRLWPKDAGRLSKQAILKKRPLMQRLAQRVHHVNRKLLEEEGGRWHIVRTADNQKEALYYLGER